MVTRDEVIAWQKAHDEFIKTPVGAAFYRFKNAHHRAVQLDTEDSCEDKDRASTKNALAEAVKAEHELLALLNAPAIMTGGKK